MRTPPASPDPHVRRWIRRQLDPAPPRAPSLLMTVWGDAIAPHGGAVMLPGMIRLLAPLHVNERLVRTSLFRLAREGWLASTRIGRRSLYRLTPDGARRFEQAHRRIYAPHEDPWDDTWELVVADGLSVAARRRLTEELRWEGFGALADTTFVRPARSSGAAARIGAAIGIGDRLIVARARDDSALGGTTLAAAVPRAWDLTAIAALYRQFLQRFGAVIERFREQDESAHDPEQCFVVRTLLIHAYRRVLLRDPQLPAALLPLDWPGAAAYALCRDFYRLTHRSAERHLTATLQGERGTLPPATAAFYRRFGGLAD
jgi:phenylacetic acid degradation operon negative regulatory protein